MKESEQHQPAPSHPSDRTNRDDAGAAPHGGKRLRPSGGYRQLRSFQVATIIYDATVSFCDRFVDKRSRTVDQMVQAARSGRQNIAEGSRAAATSSQTELRLVNVARASLDELLLDYEDFLRQRKLRPWGKDDPEARKVRSLGRPKDDSPELTDPTDAGDRARWARYAPWLEHEDPAVVANAAICLIHQANYLLDQQIAGLERGFIAEGGYSEQLATARIAERERQKKRSVGSVRCQAPRLPVVRKADGLAHGAQGPPSRFAVLGLRGISRLQRLPVAGRRPAAPTQEKRPMNEAETRAEHIDPALKAAGWGVVEGSRILREYPITLGRIEGNGRRGKPLTADYVLVYRNRKLAVIEAKAWDEELTEGVGQAKNYAGKLAIHFTYSTNGRGIYGIDMETGKEGELPRYPTPDELWNKTFAEANAWRDRFTGVPFEDKGGSHPSRYYQDIAVERVMEAIAEDRQRILLTLATGTGKTFIAFQIAWKLFHSRWNLGREPSRRPRILFLADRNILANQAYNVFSAFPEDALVRIEPEDIRKKAKVPKNGSLFFTIFQTFMSGPPEDGKPSPYFGEYPPDFFDFIVIDECHRGGANDESNWRGILDYFAPAVQLGLTATPKRRDNVDTYAYFGEPVYIYSLKEGINDGFLTPFKVKQISTTLDEYVYTPDDKLIEGEIETGKLYTETDFNKIIEIKEREVHRVKLFMEQMNQNEKTLVFCATQDHALAVRDLINQMKTIKDPNYCQRVTANDGAFGEQHLREFQDNEKTIPTILTTSQELATGVDARNIRNIVLMRPINSIIEFKQIIGRGTRLYDGKDYFTIYDFVKAHHHFSDPEWDGEPIEPERKEPRHESPQPGPPGVVREPPAEYGRRPKIKVKLADGKERTIQHMMATTFWDPDGPPMSAQQFMELLFGRLPQFFKDEAELRAIWSAPETRKKLLQGLAEKGFGGEQVAEMQKIIDAEKSDLFDVLAHVAYALPPVTREVRAANAKVYINTRFSAKQRVFLDFVLAHCVSVGVEELDQEKLTPLLRLKYHDSIADAVADLGRPEDIGKVFAGFQKYLYQQQAVA